MIQHTIIEFLLKLNLFGVFILGVVVDILIVVIVEIYNNYKEDKENIEFKKRMVKNERKN